MYVVDVRERCCFSSMCVFVNSIKFYELKVDVQKGPYGLPKKKKRIGKREVSFLHFTLPCIVFMWS